MKCLPIKGYEDLYEITDTGEVWSLERPHNLSGGIMARRRLKAHLRAYYTVCLCKHAKLKTIDVHRLVALHFIPNPENKRTVNHKNGIKTDNRVENLEWCTQKENVHHSMRTGLSRFPTGADSNTGKEVLDLYTGIFYPTLWEASVAKGITYASALYSIKLNRKGLMYI